MAPRIRALAVVLSAVVLAAAALTYWQTSEAVRNASDAVSSERSFAFTAAPLEPGAPLAVEYFTSPASFTDAIVYRGRLYLCGPGGLFTQGKEWRVGQELPAAPLTALSVGLTSESHEPELWIGTSGEGLLAFNGSQFRHIKPKDARHGKLTSVLALSSGRILLGTESAGVLVYDGRTLAPLHDDLKEGRITKLAGDDNAVWVGVLGKGLQEWRAGHVRQIDGLPDPHVLSLAAHGGMVYAGTALGAAAVRDGRVDRVVGEGLFAQALLAEQGKLTIGTLEQGVFTLPIGPGRGRKFEVPGATTALIQAADKLIAVGSAGVFDVRTGASLRTSDYAPLTDRNISALAQDKQGRLWIGYFDRGLDILDLPAGGRVRHLDDEHLFCINRVVHAQDYTAVATANGLVLMDRDATKRQVLGRNEGLIANHITDVVIRDEDMVIATPAGITFLKDGMPRSLYAFHGLVNNHVYTLASADATVLAGTLGGISLLRGDLVQASYTVANSRLPHNWITATARVNNDWWVGTYGQGVVRIDAQGNVETFPDMPAAVVNPNAMLTSGGRVYAGTLEHGLLMYSDARWHNISAGLPSRNVTALATCGSAICIGTDNGLVRLP